MVQEIEAVVPNPYQLLNNIGDKHEYFSTVDLTSAFFIIPLWQGGRGSAKSAVGERLRETVGSKWVKCKMRNTCV